MSESGRKADPAARRRGGSIGGPTVEASRMSVEDSEVSAARVPASANRKLLIKINEIDNSKAEITTMSNIINRSRSKIDAFTFY
jgi:hypothetical protein